MHQLPHGAALRYQPDQPDERADGYLSNRDTDTELAGFSGRDKL
jgi:hypothetical protein